MKQHRSVSAGSISAPVLRYRHCTISTAVRPQQEMEMARSEVMGIGSGRLDGWDGETWGRSQLQGRNEEFLALDLLDSQVKVSKRKSAM